eukprot:1869008-Rhodomonas_salina.1
MAVESVSIAPSSRLCDASHVSLPHSSIASPHSIGTHTGGSICDGSSPPGALYIQAPSKHHAIMVPLQGAAKDKRRVRVDVLGRRRPVGDREDQAHVGQHRERAAGDGEAQRRAGGLEDAVVGLVQVCHAAEPGVRGKADRSRSDPAGAVDELDAGLEAGLALHGDSLAEERGVGGAGLFADGVWLVRGALDDLAHLRRVVAAAAALADVERRLRLRAARDPAIGRAAELLLFAHNLWHRQSSRQQQRVAKAHARRMIGGILPGSRRCMTAGSLRLAPRLQAPQSLARRWDRGARRFPPVPNGQHAVARANGGRGLERPRHDNSPVKARNDVDLFISDQQRHAAVCSSVRGRCAC